MWVGYLKTWEAGHFVQVMVPVMHAQQTRERMVCLLPPPPPPPQWPIARRLLDLAPGKKVIYRCRAR